MGLEANNLTENLTTGHTWKLSIAARIGRHGIVQHPVELEREKGRCSSSGNKYHGGLLLRSAIVRRGRRHLGVIVVVVLDELADVAVRCDLAVQFNPGG